MFKCLNVKMSGRILSSQFSPLLHIAPNRLEGGAICFHFAKLISLAISPFANKGKCILDQLSLNLLGKKPMYC